MLEDIRMCSKCGLCNNQRPLLDSERTCQVFWVGLSAKKITSEEETPLSEQTNTGKLQRPWRLAGMPGVLEQLIRRYLPYWKYSISR